MRSPSHEPGTIITRSTPAPSISRMHSSYVKASVRWPFLIRRSRAPLTHGRSGDSSSHRWTCESVMNMVSVLFDVGDASELAEAFEIRNDELPEFRWAAAVRHVAAFLHED